MNLTESVQDESSTTHPGKGAAENHHNYRKRLAGFVKALTDDDIEQDYHYHQLWKAYAAYNLEEAIEHASALSSEAAKQRALKSVFMDWASRDPYAAIMFLRDPSSNAQYFGDDTRTKLFTQSYRQWLSSQAADAFSTAARSTASSEKYAFLRLACEMFPKEAIDVLPRLLLDRQANEAALYKAIQAWAAKEPYAALDWVQTGFSPEEFDTQPEFSESLAVGVVIGLSYENPSEVRSMIEGGAVSAPVVDRTIKQVANNQPPRAAVDLAFKVEESISSRIALRESMVRWASVSPEQASGWLLQIPSGDRFDEAVKGMNVAIAASDPEAALAWAAQIGDRSRRIGEIKKRVTDWHANSPTEARKWLENIDNLVNEADKVVLEEAFTELIEP